MKCKTLLVLCAACLLALSLVTVLAGCNAPTPDDIQNTVTLPDTYRITYDVKDAQGVIHAVSKSVDGNGNVFFQSGEEQFLYVKDGADFVEYKKNEEGIFVCEDGKKVSSAYIDTATAEFDEYACQSKMKHLPTMKQDGETDVLGRTCLTYRVKVGVDSFNVNYAYYVDKETGVCLGFDSDMILANISVDTSDTVFTCTEFTTQSIEDLSALISQ